jgi:tetratricopeptide (TPR) repeat protein
MNQTPESLVNQGYQARREHRPTDATAAFTKALALSTKSNNIALQAESLKGLGQIEHDLGQTSKALEHYQQAAALVRTLNQPLDLAHTVRHVADILRETRQPIPALHHYEEALDIYRSHPDTSDLDLANALRGYALLKTDTGDKQTAIRIWKEAGALYKQAGVPAGVEGSERQIERLIAL